MDELMTARKQFNDTYVTIGSRRHSNQFSIDVKKKIKTKKKKQLYEYSYDREFLTRNILSFVLLRLIKRVSHRQ